MEVVPISLPRSNSPTSTVGLPFNKRNVEEWSRLDRLTGIMETAKIETDHWAARSNNAAHNYGKVVDSRERNNPDGSLRERQRKQMEVFQTKVPGGSMQVIRTQTITTSSKKWTSTKEKSFEDLELPVNSLDLSSQKTKGSVGRSGSIGGRRPPSRPRSLISQSSDFGEESAVSKLCQCLHEQARNEIINFSDITNHTQSFSGFNSDAENDRVVTTDVINTASDVFIKSTLIRQKSCSNENLANETNTENLLRRSSKVRRSLQFHKPDNDPEDFDWCTTKSLKERAAEIENLLRHGNSTYTPQSTDRTSEVLGKVKSYKMRDSFVSADTLKEVRDRLKKRNSSDEMKDDGIVTEKEEPKPSSKVKCFVYGMESMMNGTNKKTNISGTGSLESRSSNKSSINTLRSSEWYRRRKSYGFEQVDEPEKFDKFNKRNHIDSSTDSGICQSSETMSIPSWGKDSTWNKVYKEMKAPQPTVVNVRPTYQARINRSVNSVYLDNNDTKEDKRRIVKSYNADPLPCESVWTRKSPIPVHKDTQESLQSSLRYAKNPWISQLRGTKLVDRNWASDEQEDSEESKEDKQSPLLGRDDGGKSDSDIITQKKNKKVEFCKTEVHFAAESGKFNIVETDGKPPPNDIFRRRRRNTGSFVPKKPNGYPETKFGDLIDKKTDTQSISHKIEAELKELNGIVIQALPQQKEPEESKVNSFAPSRLYDVAEEPTENGQSDTKPRSILKNYRKSFLLGETGEDSVESKTNTYDRAKSPVPTTPVWRSTVILRNKLFDDFRRKNEDEKKLYSSDGETELQIRIKSLRKTDPEYRKLWETSYDLESTKRRSLPDDILLKHSITSFGNVQKLSISNDEMPSLSVAERVKQVEELKSTNYSTKINFRSGEMTVVQNGTSNGREKKTMTSWASQKKASDVTKEDRTSSDRLMLSCDSAQMKMMASPRISISNKHFIKRPIDKLTTSNPPVMRFPTHDDKTDNQKYQTTRILINFESTRKETDTEKQNKNNKISGRINTYGSWSSGMKKDIGRYLNDLKSTWLIKETSPQDLSQRENIPKPSKPVHEIIDQFDSLSIGGNKVPKDRRRKTIPITYKPPKEYTHSDLEEELKNFTENLDKDFKDIYEEEIGSIRKWKKNQESSSRVENPVRPVPLNHSENYSVRSSSDEGSKKSSQKTSSRDNYDTDDSDLLADEEVRSYMSTGHGGTDSETEGPCGSSSSRKSFEDSIVRFKKLESQMQTKEIKNNVAPLLQKTAYADSMMAKPHGLSHEPHAHPKVASIALKYEDDPSISDVNYKSFLLVPKSRNSNTSSNEAGTDTWERTSNSSSNLSNKPRERVSYLNDLSLSEKYSKYLHKSSNSSLDTVSEFNSGRILHDSTITKLDDYSDNNERKYTWKYLARETKSENRVKNMKEKIVKEEPKLKSRNGSEERRKLANEKVTSKRSTRQNPLKKREETDSVILEELKKAADEILMAVNGYTDESSHVGSSEDDDRSRSIIRKDKIGNLGTISEGKRVTKTETRRSMSSSTGRRTAGNQSSASSLESLTKETMTKTETKPKHKTNESGKLSGRTTRLLQRASSREALMPQPSSSEDIPSYLEEAKKRVVRRQRSNSLAKPEASQDGKTTSSRSKSKSKTTESSSSTSRIRDRKTEKVKESTSVTRSRQSHSTDGDRMKSSSRRIVSEKSEGDATKRKRSYYMPSKQEHATSQTHRRTIIKKPEVHKISKPT